MRVAALTIVTFAAAACAATAGADAPRGPYKCRGNGATLVYQDAPCEPGRELRNLAESPSTVSVIPFSNAPTTTAPRPVRAARAPAKEKDKPKTKPIVDASERRHLHEGMSEGEVLARIGPPDMRAGKTGRRMRWTYLPVPGDPQTVTLLRFEDGKVKDVERRTLR